MTTLLKEKLGTRKPIKKTKENRKNYPSSSKVVVKFLKTVHLLKSCGCGELRPRDPLT
jgi:hypothetical protein